MPVLIPGIKVINDLDQSLNISRESCLSVMTALARRDC